MNQHTQHLIIVTTLTLFTLMLWLTVNQAFNSDMMTNFNKISLEYKNNTY
ncbi:hypothetical protein [Alteromonas sp. a30]|nr:hypothetical protein [Alteromonas sp. a30]MCY7293806.1 hypothetical protein [Alteromonas sp. a30]